ncbi:uncharacterized protein METZ01_LOCUS498449, partial [marine metagenome]
WSGKRLMSGDLRVTGTNVWQDHFLNPVVDGFLFIRDYVAPIEASYAGGDFCREGLMDREGNEYSSCKTFDVDHIRAWGFGEIENYRDGFHDDNGIYWDMNSIHRDSLLLIAGSQRFYRFAGMYLSYLTSPQQVFINFYDDRAWTKPFDTAFFDAFGMTQIEFSNKFYDWMATIENPLHWTDILPTAHTTELFHFPKLFNTTSPASGATDIQPNPVFSWEASTDFSSYKIQLSTTA